MPRRASTLPDADVDPDVVAMAAEQAAGLRFIPGRLEWIALDLIDPHPRNANEGDVGAIAESVAEVGFYGLLIVREVDQRYQLLAGEHRWLTLRQLGGTRGPCWVVDVDDETALRILTADNRTTRLGRDRTDTLTENLATLARTPSGLLGTGFDGDDLDALLAELAPPPPSLVRALPAPAPASSGRAGMHATCPSCGHQFTLGGS